MNGGKSKSALFLVPCLTALDEVTLVVTLVSPHSKERYESAVRKTLEKSQRAQQNQHLRGRKAARTRKWRSDVCSLFSLSFNMSSLCSDNNIHFSICVTKQCLERLIFCFCCTYNLVLINTLVPRRPPLTPWEKNLVSRLLTPTFSYLARSKSAGCQSGEEGTLPHLNSPNQFTSVLVLHSAKHVYCFILTPLQY